MEVTNHSHVQHSVIHWDNGLATFENHAFIPCGKDGLSEDESADFLINHHGAEVPEDKPSWSHQCLPTSDERLNNLLGLAPQIFKHC